jgi:hypothetical protein
MAAQYGKMVMQDAIPPWAETMVSYAGCHLTGGSKRLTVGFLNKSLLMKMS